MIANALADASGRPPVRRENDGRILVDRSLRRAKALLCKYLVHKINR
jgi:hypothetical protein